MALAERATLNSLCHFVVKAVTISFINVQYSSWALWDADEGREKKEREAESFEERRTHAKQRIACLLLYLAIQNDKLKINKFHTIFSVDCLENAFVIEFVGILPSMNMEHHLVQSTIWHFGWLTL